MTRNQSCHNNEIWHLKSFWLTSYRHTELKKINPLKKGKERNYPTYHLTWQKVFFFFFKKKKLPSCARNLHKYMLVLNWNKNLYFNTVWNGIDRVANLTTYLIYRGGIYQETNNPLFRSNPYYLLLFVAGLSILLNSQNKRELPINHVISFHIRWFMLFNENLRDIWLNSLSPNSLLE